MYNKVIHYIKENNLINEGERVLIALSGGPDSVCLLNILYELKSKLRIELGAVHINHLLRGEDSDGDEEYVKALCIKYDIPCYIKRADVNKFAEKQKLSSEVAGRQIRYDFFEKIAQEQKFNKIATAHNANDQAETLIFRLIRGSGLDGLGGIKSFRDGKIIRPILCLNRAEIEEYLKEKQIEARIDKTNFEKVYNRNKIRLDILPYIKENFNKDIIGTINRTAELLQIDNGFIEEEVLKVYGKYCIESEECFIIKKEAFIKNKAILTRIIRRALIRYSKQNYDFEMKHIYDVINLSNKVTGKKINLPNNILAENVYGDLIIKKHCLDELKQRKIEIQKSKIDGSVIEFGDYNIEFSVIKNYERDKIDFKANDNIKFFDFDKIINNIIIRNRNNGDKLIPIGMKGSKKLKDIFINEKVPQNERDLLPIICFDNEISWVVGIKISDTYKVLYDNKNILKVKIQKRGK